MPRTSDLGPTAECAQQVDLAELDSPALIGHILTHYHEAHRRELPELVALARKVEAAHSRDPALPHGLADLLEEIRNALEHHMKREELVLFTVMRREPLRLDAPIGRMRHDHADHKARLRRLAALTRGFTPPDGACRSWWALYASAFSLLDDLEEHMRLEDEVLFPRFELRPS